MKTYISTPPDNVKVYRALLTQSSTDAPTATVLENTLGGTPAFAAYDNAGLYSLVGTGLFPSGKTMVMIGDPLLTGSSSAMYTAQACWVDANTVSVETREVLVGDGTAAFTDDLLTSTPIEILVYP